MADAQDNTENIAVYARIRSSSKAAEASDDIQVVPESPDKIRARNFEFNLDQGFMPSATQEEVYGVVGAPLVQRVVDGFNACVIAYGQTGSGKTFTMLGPEGSKLDGSGGAEPGLGIVPRACLQMFKMLPKSYTVTTSYMEVYNDGVNDLLVEEYTKAKYLPLQEVSPGHIEPQGLTRVPVKDTAEVMAAVAKGDSRRVVAAMAMNPRSSRGHGIISIEAYNGDGAIHGRLVLVDLAGMESSKKSAAVDQSSPSGVKARQEEAKRINMSLLALSSVVNALAAKGAARIPFRDSKLTRLLQSSLAGNCKAAFIVTIRGEKQNVEESIMTLRFAQRAKSVQATVLKNEDTRKKPRAVNQALESELDAQKQLLASYQNKLASAEGVKEAMMAQVNTLLHEMQQLQKDNEVAKREARQAAYHRVDNHNIDALEKRVAQLEARNRALEEENRLLRQRDIMHRLVELDAAEGGNGAVGVKKDQLNTFNTPVGLTQGGFNVQMDNDKYEREARQSRAGQRVSRGDNGRGARPNTKAKARKAQKRWGILRVAVFLSKGKTGRGKVFPAPPRKWTKEDVAATKIQAVWRGKMVRDELAFWDYTDYMYG